MKKTSTPWITLSMTLLIPLALLTGSRVLAAEMTPYIGVITSPAQATLSKDLGLPAGVGLLVEQVVPESPAEGAVERFDVLYKFEDQLLISPQQLAVLVSSRKPEEVVKLVVFREGKSLDLNITLGERKQSTSRFRTPRQPSPQVHLAPPTILPFHLINPQGVDSDALRQAIIEAMNAAPGPGANIDQLMQAIEAQVNQSFDPAAPPAGAHSLRFGFSHSPGGIQMQRMNTISMSDGDLMVTLTQKNDHKHLLAKQAGKTVFEGPVNSDEEIEKLPIDVKELFNELEQTRGNFHINMLPGNGLNPGRNGIRVIPGPLPAGQPHITHSEETHHSSRTINVFDGGIEFRLKTVDGVSHVTAKKDGEILFDGPVNNPAERANLPPEVKALWDRHAEELPAESDTAEDKDSL